ncbi:hypothetical protein AB0K00_33485 [Dactylosporangium sp. NPDC049525]|uniref:hypothetical protein n=1 Tax=Dactylosporangium sp. NPDC049525 TaxID=3154730 RepID=UPI003443D83E
MSYYGTIVLARSERLLVDLPEVGSAFGTSWQQLLRRDDGWQLLTLAAPFGHQWPTVGSGPGPAAAVTGAPVLAAWVSESACVQFAAATPDGGSWSAHFPDLHLDAGGSCAYDHHRFSPLRLPAGVDPPAADRPALVRHLVDWGTAAGFAADAAQLGAALADHTDELAVYNVADVFGMDEAPEVEPLFGHDEDEWWDVWQRAQHASAWVCRDWSRGSTPMPAYDRPPPGTAELVRFTDLVAGSMYGGGLSRQDLAAEAARIPRR